MNNELLLNPEMTPKRIKNLKLAQKKMTNMIIVFNKLCEKYNIKYWALGGTLVGAVRHKGWVPWDGDVDIGMERSDYNKLVSIQDELPSDMAFFDKYTDKHNISIEGLSRIRDLYSHYNINREHKGHLGLQIDIFIYDTIILNGKKHLKSVMDLKVFKDDLYEYDLIFPIKPSTFENTYVNIPNKINQYCINVFGNYPPELPPVNNRICHEALDIDPVNPYPYYFTKYKDLYDKKLKQF